MITPQETAKGQKNVFTAHLNVGNGGPRQGGNSINWNFSTVGAVWLSRQSWFHEAELQKKEWRNVDKYPASTHFKKNTNPLPGKNDSLLRGIPS